MVSNLQIIEYMRQICFSGGLGGDRGKCAFVMTSLFFFHLMSFFFTATDYPSGMYKAGRESVETLFPTMSKVIFWSDTF